MEINKDTLEFDDDKYLALLEKEEKAKNALDKQEQAVINKQRQLNEAKIKYEKKQKEYEIATYERKSYLVNAIPEDEFTKVLNKYIKTDTIANAGLIETKVNDSKADIDIKELEEEIYDKGIE